MNDLREHLLKIRNHKLSKLEQDAQEEDGFFNASDFAGGNFDDAYYMGKDVGRAQLIEELLQLIDL